MSVRFWSISLLTVLPSFVLAAIASTSTVDPGTRVILAALAANGLVVCCFVVQPRLLRVRHADWLAIPYEFLVHGQTLFEPNTVVESLAQGLEVAGIADRVLVAVQDAQGKVLLYGGRETDGEILAERAADLARVAEDSSAESTRALCAALGCNRVLGLRGAIAFVHERERTAAPDGFWPTIAAHLSFLLVNRRLAGALQSVSGALALATPLQQALMAPEGMARSTGVICHGVVRLTPHCGGDTWTARELGDGKLLVFVGDATGHGPAAATLSVAVKGVVDGFAMVKRSSLRLDELLIEVDRVVQRIGQSRYIMSAVAAVVDLPRSTITIANAGHPPPFLVESRDGEIQIHHVDAGGGNLLGSGTVVSQIRTLPLTSGSRWIFYTDGLSEAGVAAGPKYGYRRFRDALRASAHAPAQAAAEAVLLDVDRFTRGRSLDDDVILVIVEAPTTS